MSTAVGATGILVFTCAWHFISLVFLLSVPGKAELQTRMREAQQWYYLAGEFYCGRHSHYYALRPNQVTKGG